MTTEQIFILLDKAVQKFYTADHTLLTISAPERACVFRIGHYLQQLLEQESDSHGLCVDCEYGNAVDADGKQLKKYLGFGVYADQKDNTDRIFPDLIVHKRGTHEQNMLVVEFKGCWNDKWQAWDDDRRKLEAFTNTCPYDDIQDYFYYKAGLFVALGEQHPCYVQFCDGHQIESATSVAGLFNQRKEL